MEFLHHTVLGRNPEDTVAEFQGTLRKWTNYILGWQTRFFVLKQGHLLYYKSLEDVKFGCRGAINLMNANLMPHKLDECRFDLHFCDLFWYLRTGSPDERHEWVEALSKYAASPTTDDPLHLYRVNYRWAISDKMREVESYKEMVIKQLHDLVDGFTKLSSIPNQRNSDAMMNDELCDGIDGTSDSVKMKADAITFTATVGVLLSSITDAVNLLEERDKSWFMREQLMKSESGIFVDQNDLMYGVGPELVEGQNCLLRDEEFYDAVEFGLERIEKEAELRKRLEDTSEDRPISCEKQSQHPLWKEIENVTEAQIALTCSELGDDWSLLVEGENMKMFTRDIVENGEILEPLKAVCTVKGVTGREVCHYFHSPQYRKDWEMTLERMTVVEKIGKDTMVCHQVYKRIWPAAQRDLLFWSHLWHKETTGGPDAWAVINKSIDLPQIPANDGRYVRVTLTLCLHCATEIKLTDENISRDDIACHITYCSLVNPGGWVPASAVRALSRKEYPKFLNKFTSYVLEQTKDKEILL